MRGRSNPNPRESDVSKEALKAFEAAGARLFRNSIGKVKFGPRWVAFGVGGAGGADYIGYLPVRVTRAMVGHYVAVFMAPEIKRPKEAKYSDKQVIFRDNVLAAGGIAGFTHTWEQASGLITGWFGRFR